MLILKDLGRAEEIPQEPSLVIDMWRACLGIYPGLALQSKFRARDKIDLDNPVLLKTAVAFQLDLWVYNAAASGTKPVRVLQLWQGKNIPGLGQVLTDAIDRGLSQPVCLCLDRGHISVVKPSMSVAYGRVGRCNLTLLSRAVQTSPKNFCCWKSKKKQRMTTRLNYFFVCCVKLMNDIV